MSTSLAKAGGTPSAMTSCSCTAWANDSAVMPSSLHRMSRLEDSGPVMADSAAKPDTPLARFGSGVLGTPDLPSAPSFLVRTEPFSAVVGVASAEGVVC